MQRSCLPEANSLNALDADLCLLMKVLKRCLVLFLFGFFVLDFFQVTVMSFNLLLIILHSINS